MACCRITPKRYTAGSRRIVSATWNQAAPSITSISLFETSTAQQPSMIGYFLSWVFAELRVCLKAPSGPVPTWKSASNLLAHPGHTIVTRLAFITSPSLPCPVPRLTLFTKGSSISEFPFSTFRLSTPSTHPVITRFSSRTPTASSSSTYLLPAGRRSTQSLSAGLGLPAIVSARHESRHGSPLGFDITPYSDVAQKRSLFLLCPVL